MKRKTKISSLIATGALLLAGASTSQAQMYLTGDVGPSFLQNVTIRNSGGTTASFNTGVRGGILLGYNVSPCMAVELETGAIWNSLDKVGGSSLGSGNSADLYQMPLLINAVYKTQVKNGFSGFIGVGAGGIASLLSATSTGAGGGGGGGGGGTGAVVRASSVFRAGPIGSGSASETDTDYTFAYQGKAGVKYNIAANMDVGITYKFLGTLDHHWNFDGTPFSTHGLYTHSVQAAFTLRF